MALRFRRWGTLPLVILALVAVAVPAQAGQLDPTFGGGDGIVTVGGFPEPNDFANAMIVQADGRIILGGHVGTDASQDFALARLHADGTLDGGRHSVQRRRQADH